MTDEVKQNDIDKFSTLKDKAHQSVVEECIFELGAALVQRQAYFFDSDISWFSAIELEQSINAYFDLINLSEVMGFEVAKDAISLGEDEELIGATYVLANSVYSQKNEHDLLIDLISTLGDIEETAPYVEALRHGSSSNFIINILSLSKPDQSLVKFLGLDVLGYRGDADPHRIWPLFHDKDESVKTAAMVAVMRLGFKKAVPAIEQAVLENKEMFSEHRLFPLLMLGSNKALHFSRLACQSAHHIKPQYPIYLALAGNKDDIDYLLKALKFDDMNLAVLEALGIYGALEGVNTLMKFLSSKDDEEKLVAAKSLNQISGAQLYETLSVVEKEDDDIDPETITGKATKNKEKSTVGDQRIIEVKQDCTDKKRWLEWWQENKNRFDQSKRYRRGKPYSFFLLLEEIAHPETKHEDRQRAYNELVMRSGHHIPFEPDWFVDKQIEALKKWQTWWNQNKTTFTNQWMFDGK